MKKLKIRGIENMFLLESGNVYDIDIESPAFYHQLILSLLNEDADFFIFSDNNKIFDFSKECLFVSDILTLSPNNRKILNALYKRIQEKFLTSKNQDLLAEVNTKLLSLLSDISFDVNLETDYSTGLSITDVLNLYKFSFKETNDNFLNKFLIYIKANLEVRKMSTIITLNFLPLLKEEDILLMKKELEYLNLSLINFNIRVRHKVEGVSHLTIDMDLCEF